MTFAMDITKISDGIFKIKGKTGSVLTDSSGPTIESATGDSIKTFNGPGEYEVAGISIIGTKIDDATIFVYEVDSLRICHLGETTKKLSDNKVSQIGDIDILIVPVINESIEIIQQLESYYIIPFGYKTEDELEKFLKEAGFVTERVNKFSVKKEELIEDSAAQIVVIG